MTACFPKEAQHEHHQRHTDDSSTVKSGSSTSETSGSENENTTVLPNRAESFGPKYKDITVLSTHTETSDRVTITAIEERNQRTVDELIRNPEIKKHIDTQNEKGETALFLASKGNRIYIGNIQDLLEAGADPTIPDKTGRTVLSVAYKAILLAAKNMKYDDIDYSEGDIKVSRKYYDMGPITILEDLLKAGADPILPDGDTILMKYSLAGVSVNSLLKIPSIKEMINTRNEDGETAFSLAAKEKYWEVTAELVRHNADARSLCMPDNIPDNISKEEMYVKRNNFADALKRPKYNILMICSLAGQADGVKKLLENPNVHTNINLSNISRETAFSLATEENHWEVMAELARNDADTGSLNAPDNSLCAPHNIPDNISEAELFVNTNKPYNILMICSLSGRTDSVRKLLENSNVRVHINAQNENGETAFSLAAKEILFPKTFRLGDRPIKIKRMRLFTVMRYLLSFGADPSLLPEEHFQEIQQTIATVTDDANFGDTFLMSLISRNELDSIEKLLEIPAVRENINSQNKDGETAFFLAKDKGYIQIMALLLGAGADPDIVPVAEK